jgi:hypothetical protein
MGNSEKFVVIYNSIGDPSQEWIKDAVAEIGFSCIHLDGHAPFRGEMRVSIAPGDSDLRLKVGSRTITLDAIQGVWHRWQLQHFHPTPGTREAFLRAEWTCFWNYFSKRIPARKWMNFPGTIPDAVDRLGQLDLARSLGLAIPRTMLATDAVQVRAFVEDVGGIGVVKVLGSGRPEDSPGKKLLARAFSARDIQDHDTYEAPAFVQERLPLKLELRCTIVDHQVYSAAIDPSDKGIDIKNALMDGKRYRRHPIPAAERAALVEMTESLGLRYAAIDLGITARDELVFLEINPSGMYQNIETDTAMPITEAIARSLTGEFQ